MSVSGIEAFHRPRSLEMAWHHLIESGPAARLVGGATDLSIHCPTEVRVLIDLAALDLRYIRIDDGGEVHIGAMTTLTDMLEDPVVPGWGGGVIGEMLVHVGSPLLRNVATIGGHLARGRLSDVVPVCLVVGAELEIYDGRTQRLTLDEYYRSMAHTAPHVVTEVVLPPLDPAGAAVFDRFARTSYDHALVNVAARADVAGGAVGDLRLAVGASWDPAVLVPEVGPILAGTRLEDSFIERAGAVVEDVVEPDPSWVVSVSYRRHIVRTLTVRALMLLRRRLWGTQ
jgi:CO/xanthine dehydrogenase FAD-binding subunit